MGLRGVCVCFKIYVRKVCKVIFGVCVYISEGVCVCVLVYVVSVCQCVCVSKVWIG